MHEEVEVEAKIGGGKLEIKSKSMQESWVTCGGGHIATGGRAKERTKYKG